MYQSRTCVSETTISYHGKQFNTLIIALGGCSLSYVLQNKNKNKPGRELDPDRLHICLWARVCLYVHVNVIFYCICLVCWGGVCTDSMANPAKMQPCSLASPACQHEPLSPPSYSSFSCKYSHPVVDKNLFRTRSGLLSGIDRSLMLPICSCVSAQTQPAAVQHPRCRLCRPIFPAEERRCGEHGKSRLKTLVQPRGGLTIYDHNFFLQCFIAS